MNPRLLISPCGCTQLVDLDARGLLVIDGNNLPSSEIMVISLSLNSVQFEISETFESLADFQTYLNTTFVITYDLLGYFTFEDDNLYYSNPERFQTAEVMAIIKTEITVFRIGNPGYTLSDNTLTVVPIINGNPIQSLRLVGTRIQAVRITTADIEPEAANGYVPNYETGVLTFGIYPENCYLYVQHSQPI